ncbi:MAG: outer rane efflux protein [Gemmatimonadetes bacterium]|nr:outer rane efflux protein [Gemmatimonadota bacterium]
MKFFKYSRIVAIGIATLGSIGLLSSSAEAQVAATSPTSDTITFDEAMSIALRQNAVLRQSENASTLSATVVSSRKQAFLPTLSLSTNTAQTLGRTFNQSEGTIVTQTTSTLNTGVSSSVTLFDGMRNVTALRAAQLDQTASSNELARARQTTVFTVASDFLTLVKAQEQLRIQRENLVALEAQEAQINKFVQAGTRAISDLYQQQAATASARSTVVAAQRDVELGKIGLMQTLQLDPRSNYQFATPAVATDPTTTTIHLDSLLERAFARRSDLAAEQSRVSASAQTVKGASGAKLPTVSLSVGYNTAFSSATDLGLVDQLNQRRGGSVGIGVSFPLFDRGATSIATQQARLQEDNARLALENQRQAVGLEVRRAYLDYETARQQLVATQAQQKAADLAVTTTQKRYELGSSTLLELTQARAAQLQAASAVVTARYTVAFQRAAMSYYAGDLQAGMAILGG